MRLLDVSDGDQKMDSEKVSMISTCREMERVWSTLTESERRMLRERHGIGPHTQVSPQEATRQLQAARLLIEENEIRVLRKLGAIKR